MQPSPRVRNRLAQFRGISSGLPAWECLFDEREKALAKSCFELDKRLAPDSVNAVKRYPTRIWDPRPMEVRDYAASGPMTAGDG